MPLIRLGRVLGALSIGGLLAALPLLAPAADKNYTVTAPDGVTLAVQESGSATGKPIVFIHGLLGSRLDWDKQIQSPELRRYHLITYDLRGHGLSGKPTQPEAYRDGRHWADDLASVIKASGVQKPVLVGWSLGGTVISNYLAAYGDSAIAGAVYVDGVVELKPELLTPHPSVYRDLVSEDLSTHLDAVRTFLSLCFYTQPDRATFERLLANAAMMSWQMQRASSSMSVAAAAGLAKTRVPVLMLYGANDALVNSEPTIARAKEINPQVRSILYAKTGHAPFLERPARFNRDIAAFVERATPGSR